MDACYNICTCWKFPGVQKILADCSHRDLTQIPNLVGKYKNWSTELNLSRNRIQNMSFLENGIEKNVQVLDLSNNSRTAISIDSFTKSLQILRLHDNNITKLDYSVIEYLESPNTTLSTLSLYGNPWECDCNSKKLTKISFIRNNLDNVEKIRCENYKEFLFQVDFSDFCNDKNDTDWPYKIIGIFAIVIFVISTAFCGWYQQKIKLLLVNNFCCLRRYRAVIEYKGETYDAFVSFAHEDTDFVHNVLAPRLEKESTEQFKLCLHTRDWVPGEWITEQISKSVNQSRRTIIIFSKSFLKSIWSLMEFRLAYIKALQRKEGWVIVILYIISLDEVKDDIDEELRVYLKKNTYIEWGDPYFWRKLKKSLKEGKEPRKTTWYLEENILDPIASD